MADEDMVLVTLDGAPHDPSTPLLYADDLAVLRGDGVFETVLVRDGEPAKVELHLERMRRSADILELPALDLPEWRSAIEAAVQRWGAEREGVMKLVYSRGREPLTGGDPDETTGFITIGPVPERVLAAREKGVSVVTVQRGYSVELANDAPWLQLGAKTLSYATNLGALRFARRMGADDAIFLSTEQRVLEGTRSAVLVLRDDKLITPPHKYGIVPSTTQQALFEVAEKAGLKCQYKPLFAADLIIADGLWLVSSVALAARVHTLDGLSLSEPELAGKVTGLVEEAVRRVGSLKR
jgi:4-amino-4-deoxychorismate lyase